MGEVGRRRISLHILHFLWAVPLAFVIGIFPAALVRFHRCGIQACLGDPGGFASPLAPSAVGVASLGALAMFCAFAIVPWLRPAWLRLLIAFVAAVLMFAFYGWYTLFFR